MSEAQIIEFFFFLGVILSATAWVVFTIKLADTRVLFKHTFVYYGIGFIFLQLTGSGPLFISIISAGVFYSFVEYFGDNSTITNSSSK